MAYPGGFYNLLKTKKLKNPHKNLYTTHKLSTKFTQFIPIAITIKTHYLVFISRVTPIYWGSMEWAGRHGYHVCLFIPKLKQSSI